MIIMSMSCISGFSTISFYLDFVHRPGFYKLNYHKQDLSLGYCV